MTHVSLTAAHGGDEWQARSLDASTRIGVTTEYGRLRRVMLHRPGPEIDGITNAAKVLWDDIVEPTQAREQHDMLVSTYRHFGVEVVELAPGAQATPNIYFCRDHFFMTPRGAIIARMASAARAGEEWTAARALINHGVPIVHGVHGEAVFEGADVVYVRDGVVLVATGLRTNMAGAQQVAHELKSMGFDPHIVNMPWGCGHIDGGVNIVGPRTAVMVPNNVPHAAYELLRSMGFTIINAMDAPGVTHYPRSINMVPVAPNVVIMPSGNPALRKLFEAHDIECHEVDISQLFKGGGGIHCMTGVILRD
ncbi:MAG: dimethylarginine dimethylaminohydrolase family protein [Roseiflexaceae bacterium]|jgi:arginine deiminase